MGRVSSSTILWVKGVSYNGYSMEDMGVATLIYTILEATLPKR